MQDVGDEQFLMLLLVIQSDFKDAGDLRPCRHARRADQRLDRGIDVLAIIRDLNGIRPRDQSALGARVARTGGDIVGVEQEREALIEHLVTGHVRPNQEGL